MQGIKSNDTIMYQDNMSSILLEKNGQSSNSKQTRHMNIRFFFIKDRVESKEIRVGNTVFAGSQSLGICENKKNGLCKTELTAIQMSTINSDQ